VFHHKDQAMRNIKIKILVIGVLIIPKTLSGQPANTIVTGEKHIIHSEIIGEDKEYWVHLPLNYDKTTDKYPVLYLTDGDQHFSLAAGLTDFMGSQFMIPDFIVVCIFHKDRIHDLTPTHSLTDVTGFKSDAARTSGGGEKLLQFIEKELIAEIDKQYRTYSYRVLAGHSLGGLFCIYAYLNSSDLFKGFISMDPVLMWDNSVCERTLKALTDQSPNFKNKLYISSAHNALEGKPDKGPHRISQLSFTKVLKAKGVSNAKFELFEDESHLQVPYRSLYRGLLYMFPEFYILKNPGFNAEIPFIKEHYENMSELYGMKFIPPEFLLEMVGKYYLFERNEYDRSIEFFQLNTLNYPASCKAFEFLGRAYEAVGNREEAILNLKKALELNPENIEIRKMLIELEEQ